MTSSPRRAVSSWRWSRTPSDHCANRRGRADCAPVPSVHGPRSICTGCGALGRAAGQFPRRGGCTSRERAEFRDRAAEGRSAVRREGGAGTGARPGRNRTGWGVCPPRRRNAGARGNDRNFGRDSMRVCILPGDSGWLPGRGKWAEGPGGMKRRRNPRLTCTWFRRDGAVRAGIRGRLRPVAGPPLCPDWVHGVSMICGRAAAGMNRGEIGIGTAGLRQGCRFPEPQERGVPLRWTGGDGAASTARTQGPVRRFGIGR